MRLMRMNNAAEPMAAVMLVMVILTKADSQFVADNGSTQRLYPVSSIRTWFPASQF